MFQAAYSTGSLFIFDEFYCTSGCFQDLFIVSLCFHPSEWWSYLLLWTGLCTAVASVDADICLGRFNRRHPCGSYCTLQRDCDVLSGDTVLIKTLKFLVLSLNWKATLFLSILLYFFLLLLCRHSWWECFTLPSSSRLASLPKARSGLWCRTTFFSFPAYMHWLSSLHPCPSLFFFI